MPYNGSGTFTLAESAFVPNTPISSAAMNSDLSDIATNGLTNAVTKDGQTTITGPFKGANGSVGAPMYSFSSDTNTGMYRIGADNIGISAGGVKILDIGAGGLTSLYLVQPAGTVSLPSYTFSGDLNTGIYQIGADNIGVAVNATKILDISSAGLNVIGTVSSNGSPFSPLAQGAGMVNGTIVESHAGNAVTFAIKTLAGADPSASDPVFFVFRNATAATGNYAVVQATAALSIIVTSGSTLGTSSSNVPFRIWLVVFNDGGTLRLGVINCLSGTTIYPLGGFGIASALDEGGGGGADLAKTFYVASGTTATSKAYAIIGYASYETGLTTAGSWAASPTRLQLFGAGVPLPGQSIQVLYADSSTAGFTTSTTYVALTNGLTLAITPTSASNLIKVETFGNTLNSGSTSFFFRLSRGTSAASGLFGSEARANFTASQNLTASMMGFDFPGVTTSVTYAIQGKSSGGNTISYPDASAFATMSVEEIMA